MPGNPMFGQEGLATTEWDLPLTEDFVDRVRAGVWRRRIWRRALIGASAAASATVVVLLLTAVVRPSAGPPVAGPPVIASSTMASLDGFVLGYLPDGATRSGPDSFYAAAVGPDGLGEPGSASSPGQPAATVTMRRFTATNIDAIFVSVLRPSPATRSDTPPSQVTTWLTDGVVGKADKADPFGVPAGRAYLLDHVGTEVTTHTLVITATNGAVIVVEGPGSLSADELRHIAAGVAPG